MKIIRWKNICLTPPYLIPEKTLSILLVVSFGFIFIFMNHVVTVLFFVLVSLHLYINAHFRLYYLFSKYPQFYLSILLLNKSQLICINIYIYYFLRAVCLFLYIVFDLCFLIDASYLLTYWEWGFKTYFSVPCTAFLFYSFLFSSPSFLPTPASPGSSLGFRMRSLGFMEEKCQRHWWVAPWKGIIQ